MWRSFTLLLPALIPSWRFFDVIGPSPRIEFAWLHSPHDVAKQWHEVRPRPLRLSFTDKMRRLFYSPQWNETLFLLSFAERVMENPTDQNFQEILKRLQADLIKDSQILKLHYLQFRLICISRHKNELQRSIVFVSQLYACSESAAV